MSNKLTQMAREILQIEADLPYRFDYKETPSPTLEDFEIHTFEQVWGSTALGFGGMGGQDELSTYRNKHQMGHAGSNGEPFDRKKAHEWVKKMKNADGSTGPHYKIEQSEQLRQMYCMECDKWEFYVAINMMYSDYCEVARQMGLDRSEYYANMAKAFLCDEDAGENKLQKYFTKVVK